MLNHKVLYESTSSLVEKEIRKYTNNDQSTLDLNNYYKRFLKGTVVDVQKK